MDLRKYLSLLALAFLTIVALQPADACSCMPSHPQTHYCDASYAIVVRVLRRSHRLVANRIAYKVEIKKSYKMNAEAQKMLKHGRILTSDSEATCGVHLVPGRLYMIAGRSTQLNACNYIKEYLQMSAIERRGFAGVYRKGCNCKIKPCFGNDCLQSRETESSCKWSPMAKCETIYSACMPTVYRTPEGVIRKCHWRRTPSYKECMADP